MAKQTKRAIEVELADGIVQFQREQHGRGSVDVRVQILGDLVLVRSQGILTVTETRLAGSEEGRRLVRSSRQELRSIALHEIEGLVSRITGSLVLRSYADVNVDASEQIEIYVLNVDLERKLLRQELDALQGLTSRPTKPDTK